MASRLSKCPLNRVLRNNRPPHCMGIECAAERSQVVSVQVQCAYCLAKKRFVL